MVAQQYNLLILERIKLKNHSTDWIKEFNVEQIIDAIAIETLNELEEIRSKLSQSQQKEKI